MKYPAYQRHDLDRPIGERHLNAAFEKSLWDAVDQFRTESGLKPQEYPAPNLGLEGEIKHGGNINSYYDDPHDATGRFDFVLTNPLFNINAVDFKRYLTAYEA